MISTLRNRGFETALYFILALTILNSTRAIAQTKEGPEELYGGIEIGSKGVKATAIKVSPGPEGLDVKLVYGEVINTTLMKLKDNRFAPEIIDETVAAVHKLMTKMIEHRVPVERINVVGSSGLRAENPQDVVKAVKEKTGKEMNFLDVESEVQLSIVGTIPQRVRLKKRWIDNREISLLLDIGSGNTKGGYQNTRQTTDRSKEFDYVTVGVPQGTVSFTNEITRNLGADQDLQTFAKKAVELRPTVVQGALRNEMERKPGLVNRPRVYLSGGAVWAMTTMLHPEDRRAYVPLTEADINRFYTIAVSHPEQLQQFFSPDLSGRVPDPAVRKEIQKDLDALRNTFTPQNLIAGAVILKSVSDEFGLSSKRVRFARNGYLSWILSYVRLGVE